MVADLSDPKYYAITACIYLFFMLVIWKLQIGKEMIDLTWIRIIISIAFLPICAGMVYVMSDD